MRFGSGLSGAYGQFNGIDPNTGSVGILLKGGQYEPLIGLYFLIKDKIAIQDDLDVLIQVNHFFADEDLKAQDFRCINGEGVVEIGSLDHVTRCSHIIVEICPGAGWP